MEGILSNSTQVGEECEEQVLRTKDQTKRRLCRRNDLIQIIKLR